jgi:leader peptidase (prepilin peptidase) / N-methyltransferase
MRPAIFAVLGLVFGSFLSVVISRVPEGRSVIRPRSRCPRCGAQIRFRDNIPVLSYLALRGRCRSCGERISPAYPAIEGATAILFLAAAILIRPLERAALAAPFLGVLLALGIIDAQHRILPNRIVYPAIGLAAAVIIVLALAGLGVDPVRALLGLLIYAGPLFLIALIVPRGMGMGDVKLAALIGLVLGSFGLAYVGVAAGLGVIGGGLGALLALVVLGYGRRHQLAFGPFLAGGAILAALFAPQIARAYLSLSGLG